MDKLCSGYGLVEGPAWDQKCHALLYSDVLNGGLVVSGRNVSWKSFSTDVGGETAMLLDRDESAGNVGYNDLTTDEYGHIRVGSFGSSTVFEDSRDPAPGDLYLIDIDGMARIDMEDIRLTNGRAVSADGKTLYHSDTTSSVVNRYTVCTDGGRGVQAYAEDGRELTFIEIPQPMCTSCCFGDDDLYIVSGSNGGEPNSGAVWVERLDHTGLVVHPAIVQLEGGT